MATDYHNFPKPARVFDKYWDIFARQLSTDFVDFLCNIRKSRSNLWFKRVSASVQTISRQPIPRYPSSGANELRSNTSLPGWGFSRSANNGKKEAAKGRLYENENRNKNY